LALESSITILLKMNKKNFDQCKFSDPYVVVEFNGTTTTIEDYYVDGNYYVFEFPGVSADRMTEIITAYAHATKDGVEHVAPANEYSVEQYALNMLPQLTDDSFAETRTLIVNMLKYGDAAQIYNNTNLDKMATGNLEPEWLAWGTDDHGVLDDKKNNKYEVVDSPAATWKAVGLELGATVVIRYRFEVASLEGVTFKIHTDDPKRAWEHAADDNTTTIDDVLHVAEYKEKPNQYYLYFSGLYSSEMNENVYITAYKDGKEISNTYRYSIESYAANNYDKVVDVATKNLLSVMVQYGDAAYAYVH
jgi:hypothetical protein